MTLANGEVVAWRNCPRDLTGAHGPSFAIGMRIVRDEPGVLMLYRGSGYPMRRRNSDRIAVEGFRHDTVRRLLDGWSDGPSWSGSHVLLGMDPRGRHATSLFRDAVSNEVRFWYVDLIGPVDRRGTRFDFDEHGLDVVISPDLSEWHYKDDDELEWCVSHGIYTRGEADFLYAEGKRAVDELRDDPRRFDDWLSWRPDPSWPVPAMPDGWDAI